MNHTVTIVKSTWGAFVAGILSAATPVVVSVVNHRYGGGSTWIDAFAVILMTVTIFSLAAMLMGVSYRGTVDGGISYLEAIRNSNSNDE